MCKLCAIGMVENNEELTDYEVIIKWRHVDVMRLSLSLGAWWPGGRS